MAQRRVTQDRRHSKEAYTRQDSTQHDSERGETRRGNSPEGAAPIARCDTQSGAADRPGNSGRSVRSNRAALIVQAVSPLEAPRLVLSSLRPVASSALLRNPRWK